MHQIACVVKMLVLLIAKMRMFVSLESQVNKAVSQLWIAQLKIVCCVGKILKLAKCVITDTS